MSFFAKFRIISSRRFMFLVSSSFLSIYIYILMKFFRRKSHFVSSNPKELNVSEFSLLQDIQWAVKNVSRIIPWECVCRHQAYLATIFCRVLNIKYTIVVGTKINKEKQIVEGHVWTISDGVFLSGACNVNEYTIIQTI